MKASPPVCGALNTDFCPEASAHQYLILLIPAKVIPVGEFLRSLHHKVDEVPTPTKAAGDKEVCQNPEKPAQVDVLVLLVFLLVHNGLLFLSKKKNADC